MVPFAIKKFDTTQAYKRKKTNLPLKQQSEETQDQAYNTKVDTTDEDIEIALKGFMKMRVLETVYEADEKSWPSLDAAQDTVPPASHSLSKSSTEQSSTPFKQLLQISPNRQTRKFQKINKRTMAENASEFIRDFAKSTLSPATEYDRQTLIRHALAEKYDEMEDFFSFPHLLGSCIFALIQSASEVAAVVSPYGAIHDVFSHRENYSGDGKDDAESVNATGWWFRAIGGFSAAVGFFLCYWWLTQSLGGKLSYTSNSRGLASQLSTVAAMIVVCLFKLPVSSVHAFVGSLIGVGIADDPRNVNWKLLLKFISGWVLTLVFCCGFAYVIFSASLHSPAYVVP
ncbi:Phosphate transporter [Parasponia andersonii]|uniref:Phosphate transporter n=1 Tax=Parasponia andersonii TaxID=3476 RepID=A0A2P5E510_PARAD|nr:Phosphate transporter [Parasponia andersonii]